MKSKIKMILNYFGTGSLYLSFLAIGVALSSNAYSQSIHLSFQQLGLIVMSLILILLSAYLTFKNEKELNLIKNNNIIFADQSEKCLELTKKYDNFVVLHEH